MVRDDASQWHVQRGADGNDCSSLQCEFEGIGSVERAVGNGSEREGAGRRSSDHPDRPDRRQQSAGGFDSFRDRPDGDVGFQRRLGRGRALDSLRGHRRKSGDRHNQRGRIYFHGAGRRTRRGAVRFQDQLAARHRHSLPGRRPAGTGSPPAPGSGAGDDSDPVSGCAR